MFSNVRTPITNIITLISIIININIDVSVFQYNIVGGLFILGVKRRGEGEIELK